MDAQAAWLELGEVWKEACKAIAEGMKDGAKQN